jgi:CTP synthase (UTP-ammonia lyase)
MAGALLAIQFARENGIPFLGTCGGFQHAVLEFTKNVLRRPAEHAEENPAAENPVIQPLSCSLAGRTGRIIAEPGSGFERLLGASETREEFNCNYGFNASWETAYLGTALEFVARDELAQVRAVQVRTHPFFVGTLFQPERKVLSGSGVHPLVSAFVDRALAFER